MTITTNLEHDTDNAGPLTREKLERELLKFGKAEGQGANSRPSAALMCVDAAHRLQNVGADDAEKLYTIYAKGVAATQGIEYKASASQKVQVSKLRRFLMLGQLPAIDGVDVMNKACDKIVELSRRAESPLRGSAYDNMVKVARRQIEQPTVELTSDQIEEILSEGPEDKTELDKVVDAYRKVYKVDEALQEAGMDNYGTNNALEDLAHQISMMGGELPPMTKEERDTAKAKGILAKRGLTVVPAAAPVTNMVQAEPAADPRDEGLIAAIAAE